MNPFLPVSRFIYLIEQSALSSSRNQGNDWTIVRIPRARRAMMEDIAQGPSSRESDEEGEA